MEVFTGDTRGRSDAEKYRVGRDVESAVVGRKVVAWGEEREDESAVAGRPLGLRGDRLELGIVCGISGLAGHIGVGE